MSDKQTLLPSGFSDLIGKEAKINHEITTKIISNFLDKNYDLVRTPLIEFEQTLSNYQKLNEQSFHVPDISSGKNLVFRNDITVQIARLVSTRLKDATLPLRLCYLGDVLKVDNQDLHSDRQLTQAGIELIGDGDNGVVEVLEVTLSSLKNAKINNLIIEFCLPKFLDLLLAELKIKNSEEIAIAIAQKNVSKIKELSGRFSDVLTNLALEIKDCPKIRENLAKLPISNDLRDKINNSLEIIAKIKAKYPKITILTNIFSDLEFSYHQDIGFAIFFEESLYPIVRGGKYQINNNLVAVGSTIYVDGLRNIFMLS